EDALCLLLEPFPHRRLDRRAISGEAVIAVREGVEARAVSEPAGRLPPYPDLRDLPERNALVRPPHPDRPPYGSRVDVPGERRDAEAVLREALLQDRALPPLRRGGEAVQVEERRHPATISPRPDRGGPSNDRRCSRAARGRAASPRSGAAAATSPRRRRPSL